MKILFLDDDAIRTKTFRERTIGLSVFTCETVHGAISLLRKHEFAMASLDHDLGGLIHCPSDEKSGYEVAKIISKKYPDLPCIIHSFNPSGAKRMLDVLPNAVLIPFGSETYWRAFKECRK